MISHSGSVFSATTTYMADLSGSLKFAGVPESVLWDIYRDGRRLSFPLPYAVEHHFANLVHMDDNASPTLLLDTLTGKRYRIKVMTRHGCDFATSSMLGTQRTHKETEYAGHWHHEIDGWIVVDNRFMPKLLIAAVDKHVVTPPQHLLDHTSWARILRSNNRKRFIQ